MGLFGTEKWLARAEVFSVYMNMFSQLAPLELRDGKLGRRRALSAAGHGWTAVPGSVAVVIATIGATQLRRRPGGPVQELDSTPVPQAQRPGLRSDTAFRIDESIVLVIVVAGIGGVFALGLWGMRIATPTARPRARRENSGTR